MIKKQWKDKTFQDMADFYTEQEPDIFYLTHYEIVRLTDVPCKDPQLWKQFITDSDVADYITSELQLLSQIEMNKILKNLSSNANSVGTGQTLNALIKYNEPNSKKQGPVFVYTYIPLTEQELQAENINILPDDIFRKD